MVIFAHAVDAEYGSAILKSRDAISAKSRPPLIACLIRIDWVDELEARWLLVILIAAEPK